MGHQGNVKNKILSIERIDQYVIGPVVEALQNRNLEFRMLVLPDHPTPIRVRTHVGDPVPYLLYDSEKEQAGPASYDEKTGAGSGRIVEVGHTLIEHLFEKW